MTDYASAVPRFLEVLRAAHTYEQVVKVVVDTIAKLTQWTCVSLLSVDQKKSTLQVVSAAGCSALDADWQIPTDSGLFTSICHADELCLIFDAPSMSQELGLQQRFSCMAVAPLRQGRRVHMVLLVATDTLPAFDAAAQVLIATFVEAIMMALKNARLYKALQGELAERQSIEGRLWNMIHKTETLYRVSRSLISPAHFEEVLPVVLNNVAGALNACRVFLITLDLINWRVDLFASGGPGGTPSKELRFEDLMESVVGNVVREGLPVINNCTTQDPRMSGPIQQWCSLMDVGPLLVTPVFLQNRAHGVLLATRSLGQRDFQQQDTDLLMAIAAQFGAAIQNAHLFQTVIDERRRLRALVQSSRDGIILIGEELRVLVVNRPALRYLTLPGKPEDWTDRLLWDALSYLRESAPQVVRATLADMRRVRRGDARPGEGEYVVGLRTFHWVNLPILGGEDDFGRLLVLRDVTEERLLEQFREDLTHTMVHDLRNPLTGIDAALKLFPQTVDNELSSNQQKILDIAQRSTLRMLNLVNAILDISRLESGNMPLNLTEFSFAEMVASILAMETALAEQHDIQLINQVPRNLPHVCADAVLMDRVIQNLVGNALKFTPSGGSVRVRAEVEPELPDKVRVSISDTGSGIPAEIKTHLFEKFITGQQVGRGSGLGLAFCRMVLEAHGERIWVSKTSHTGTIFTFTLPLSSTKAS